MVRDGLAPPHLRDLVEAAFRKAEKRGYPAQLTNEERGVKCKRSRTEHHVPNGETTGKSGLIFICVEAGTDAVWDLLHELGHALNGHEPGKEQTCGHETAMWKRGWHWARTQSGHGSALTRSDTTAFAARAAQCLRTYCGPTASISI